jgi:hypothetical protein
LKTSSLASILITSVLIAGNYLSFACKISCLANTSSGNATDRVTVNVTNTDKTSPLYTSPIKSPASIGMINYNTTTLPQVSNATYNSSLTSGNNITTNGTGNLSQALLSVDNTLDEEGSRDKHSNHNDNDKSHSSDSSNRDDNNDHKSNDDNNHKDENSDNHQALTTKRKVRF